ncbi:oligosaccharide flippase family protein [Arthrobacter sp. BE255]|uniref:oligosaccharide flippase family protein n=1 Tax=Arthrobacter sp. BE255 TaxID=2817721 RepID=UPI0028555185|nr:oligosaccharide flippase family protein [Arthrobacter sp. BE255]MDR7160371.1 PST family polysaccharide transporter [Arthrobacter sp. BE255]
MTEGANRTQAIETLERHVLRGAMWSGVNTLLMKVANIAVMATVVRIITPEDFGVFAIALVVHAVVSSIGELGLSSCIARRDLEPDKVAPTVALLSLISSFVLALGMAFAAEPLAVALGSSNAAEPIRVLSISVFLGGVFTVPGALLVRDFRQDKVLLAGGVAFLPMNALLLLLAMAGDGAMAFAWSRVAGQLISGIVMAMSVKLRYWPGLDSTQVIPILRFGLPLAGANLLSYVLLNADYAIIARSLGPGELGIYMLAFTVASWSTSVLSTTINSVAMPAFSARGSDTAGLQLMLKRAATLVASIAFPIGAMTVALAHPLISVLYGDAWVRAAPLLSVLAVYGAVFSLSLLMSNLLVGTGRSQAVIAVQAFWIVSLVPAVALSVSISGLIGAAYAHVAVIILIVLPAYVFFVRRLLPSAASILFTSARLPFAWAVAAGVCAAWVSALTGQGILGLLAGSLAGGLIYTILMLPTVRKLLPELPSGKVKRLAECYDRLKETGSSKVADIRNRHGK